MLEALFKGLDMYEIFDIISKEEGFVPMDSIRKIIHMINNKLEIPGYYPGVPQILQEERMNNYC